MAAMAIGACMWSGVETLIESRFVALLVEQLAPVLVDARLREPLLDPVHAREIDVGHGDQLEARDASRSW